ncbi:hypothetical protein FA95DRAFT_1284834 [Auriscalpium vulgare]|uniref:Uncharacterized protein n=1 Tax=Auriscalpium vulgare TaxID=40419 RepID=A0ACB8RTB4_9AGAM|nr:hypothetical protein FA95DRAFT_1284834 [Auriscalpium vulgare]
MLDLPWRKLTLIFTRSCLVSRRPFSISCFWVASMPFRLIPQHAYRPAVQLAHSSFSTMFVTRRHICQEVLRPIFKALRHIFTAFSVVCRELCPPWRWHRTISQRMLTQSPSLLSCQLQPKKCIVFYSIATRAKLWPLYLIIQGSITLLVTGVGAENAYVLVPCRSQAT